MAFPYPQAAASIASFQNHPAFLRSQSHRLGILQPAFLRRWLHAKRLTQPVASVRDITERTPSAGFH